jgi:ribosomal protein S18 acetylase RimI-like enzyme
VGDRLERYRSLEPLGLQYEILSPVITLEPITTRNVPVFKDVRLRALQDTPSAFGSTYAREVQLTDAEWAQRAALWNGEKGIGFLAMDAGAACGLAGAFLDEAVAARAQLISMWMAPTHRQRGIGRLLVEEIVAWARRCGATALQLMVTSSNRPAMLFYERLGFTRTGRTEPYPNDPNLIEYEMSRPLL